MKTEGRSATDLTIDDLVVRAARARPDAVFVVEGSRRLTFAELDRSVEKIARALTTRIAPGDRVVLWLPNCIEFVVWFFGCTRAGGVAVPMNTELQVDEAKYLVEHSGATLIATQEQHRGRALAAMALEIGKAVEERPDVVIVEGTAAGGAMSAEDFFARANVLVPRLLPTIGPDSTAFMLYTSGTTGKPKGVMHSHRFIAVTQAAADRMAADENDVLVLYLPMYHIYGLVAGLLLFLSIGGRVVLMRAFRAVESLELMEAEQATIVYGVPTTYIDQLDSPDLARFDLASVRLCFAPFAFDLSSRVSEQWGKTVNVYGMTETAATALLPTLDDDDESRRATVGLPLDGVEARIVDESTGLDLGSGQTGELLLRGASVTIGYHNNPADTAYAIDTEGWLRTGDLAQFDAQRRIRFVGRRGDLYRVGGELVDPVEVEAVLQQHAAIARAAVLGVQDDRLGHLGRAWVQLREGSEATVEELADYAKARLARFKVPGRIEIVEVLPTTPSGKIQKYKLLSERTVSS